MKRQFFFVFERSSFGDSVTSSDVAFFHEEYVPPPGLRGFALGVCPVCPMSFLLHTCVFSFFRSLTAVAPS